MSDSTVYTLPTMGRVMYRPLSSTEHDAIVKRSVGDDVLRHALMAACIRREDGAAVRTAAGWRRLAEISAADYADALRVLRRHTLTGLRTVRESDVLTF